MLTGDGNHVVKGDSVGAEFDRRCGSVFHCTQHYAILRNVPQATPTHEPTSPSPTSPRSTERGLALLKVVADHAALDATTGIALADAARAVDLSPSTALRQLRSLEAAGFVARSEDGRYLPGLELLRIARGLAGAAGLPRMAERVLDELAAATGESAYLAEPADEHEAVYVALAAGHHAVRHVSWLGTRVQRKGSAVGAALHGTLDEGGVAVRTDAVEPGVTAISAPVCDASGRIIAAVSVVGPSFRLTGRALTTASSAVAAAAGRLSTAMGGAQATSDRTGR